MKELLEILSTPYQLTEYREDWPNGKKGCLFYIPEIEEFGHGYGTICLIDAWWRKDDVIGMHNVLHHIEWDLATDSCIVRGFGAFLIRLGWIERNFEAVPERWSLYCKWVDENKKLRWNHPMEQIAEECYNWLRRDDDVLQKYLNEQEDEGLYLYLTIRDTIRYVVKQVIDDIPTMMWQMQPVIKWDINDNSNGSWMTYYVDLDTMMSEGKSWFEFMGFRASMLNYFAAHYICRKVLQEEDESKAAEWICDGFYHYEDEVQHSITLNKIPFVYNGLDIGAVYDCYRNRRKELITIQLKKEIDFAFGSEEEKNAQIIHEMLYYEHMFYPFEQHPLEKYMSEKTKSNLKRLLFHYMMSVISLYNEPCSDEDRDIMFECFPEEMNLIALVAKSEQEKAMTEDKKNDAITNSRKKEVPTQEQLEKTFTYVYRNDKRAFYPHLIEFLLQERDRTDHYAAADWARHALVIYEQQPTILKHRPSTFAKWLDDFSKMFGRECQTMYEPGKIKKRRKSYVINFMPVQNTSSSVG